MTLTDLFTNIANAIRAKTGSTEPIVAEDFPSAIEAIPVGNTIDLDAEVTEQETIAASQDALVGDIMAALEGKAAGGGKTTKTINIDWSGDEELLGRIYYISNNKVESTFASLNDNFIEAENGVIRLHSNNPPNYTSNFIVLYENTPTYILVATQDGETVYPISTGEQDN